MASWEGHYWTPRQNSSGAARRSATGKLRTPSSALFLWTLLVRSARVLRLSLRLRVPAPNDSRQVLNQKPTRDSARPTSCGSHLSCAPLPFESAKACRGEPNSLLWPNMVARMCQLCLRGFANLQGSSADPALPPLSCSPACTPISSIHWSPK